MKAADLGALVFAGSPAVSPDGTRIAYVVTRVDVEANTYRRRIWVAAADGSEPPLPLTSGRDGDANPTWSPDGRQLAFTSRRGGEGGSGAAERTASLHLIPVDRGGETISLAEGKEGFGSLAWSPDGRWLAYTTRTRADRYDSDDPAKQPPRKIDRLYNRVDTEGWTIDRPTHVYVVPTDGSAAPRNLTPGRFEHGQPAWFPDSQRLVVTAARHDTWDLDRCSDIYLIDREGSAEPRALTHQTGEYSLGSVSPDGGRVAFCGFDDTTIWPQNSHVGIVDLATGERRWVTRAVDRTWVPFPYGRAPVWAGPTTLYLSHEDRGNVVVCRLDLDAAGEATVAETPVVHGERVVTGFDAAGGTLGFAATTMDRPAELFAIDLTTGAERCLSRVSDGFVAQAAPVPAERFTVASAPGIDVGAWLLVPADLDPERRYPCLLNVHGGPFTQYGNSFFDEAQLQVGAGFVVLMANPRGGSGREDAWAQAIIGPKHPTRPAGGWGSVDFDDLMAVVDVALQRFPFIDPTRLGMLGGSYGGFMATFIAGHTDRFRAICSERAANNMLSLEWGSDIAGAFHVGLGASHLDDPDEFMRRSPVSSVASIETPILIIHSEDDLRCPVFQADELFVALRLLGKEVEYYRFPAESHELSRSGSPVHRIQRAEIVLEYFTRHLAETV